MSYLVNLTNPNPIKKMYRRRNTSMSYTWHGSKALGPFRFSLQRRFLPFAKVSRSLTPTLTDSPWYAHKSYLWCQTRDGASAHPRTRARPSASYLKSPTHYLPWLLAKNVSQTQQRFRTIFSEGTNWYTLPEKEHFWR